MNYLRVIVGLLIVWAGAFAIVYEPGRTTFAVVATGTGLLVLTLLLEARIRQGDPRQVLIGGVGLLLGFVVAFMVLAVLGGLPVTAELLASGSLLTTFVVAVIVLLLGYLGAATARAVTYDLVLFRQADQESGSRARFLVGEKSLIDGRIVKLAESPLLSGEIIVPRFVVDQLNQLAASGESKSLHPPVPLRRPAAAFDVGPEARYAAGDSWRVQADCDDAAGAHRRRADAAHGPAVPQDLRAAGGVVE